ncbi:MAG: enoyl-CoA hydratase/isomerase family protein [Sphingomonadaceae bacterium]
MSERIHRADIGGLCTLSLNRPDKLNALDTQTFEKLDAHLAALESQTETIGCVVLRGNGRAFCAGADLGTMETGIVTSPFKPGVIQRLGLLPQPVVIAVHGVCFTGGLELALAGDFILADGTARFADTHGKWGLVGGWGLAQRLPRRIGAQAAKRMMFTACEVHADEAKAIGLADLICEDGGLDALVGEFTNAILANSWHTNMATKRMMQETDAMSLAEALLHEREHYPGFAPDYRERIASFSRK